MNQAEHVLKKYKKKYPYFYEIINDNFVKCKGNGEIPNWDDRCFVPISAGIAVTTMNTTNMLEIMDAIPNAGVLTQLCCWQANNKKVEKIDECISQILIRDALTTEYTVNINKIFDKINYGIYLRFFDRDILEIIDADLDGIFLSLESDTNNGSMELRCYVVDRNSNKKPKPFILVLQEGESLSNCVKSTLKILESDFKKIAKEQKVLRIEDIKSLKNIDSLKYTYLLNYYIFSIIFKYIQM